MACENSGTCICINTKCVLEVNSRPFMNIERRDRESIEIDVSKDEETLITNDTMTLQFQPAGIRV